LYHDIPLEFSHLAAEEPYMGVSANQTQERHSSRDSRAGLYL